QLGRVELEVHIANHDGFFLDHNHLFHHRGYRHYLKNKEKITARRQQNKASIAKTAAKYYVENKASIAIYGAKWQVSNRHYLSSRRKARYSSDPDFRRSELRLKK
ncbi:hypothetical protein Q6264_28035, partial [Klebsiella pneumoniae]|uniref:hypothetical protein n=1 Tax=Klebsiella pneumoniae TaxID=573 RepID=UPI00272F533A